MLHFQYKVARANAAPQSEKQHTNQKVNRGEVCRRRRTEHACAPGRLEDVLMPSDLSCLPAQRRTKTNQPPRSALVLLVRDDVSEFSTFHVCAPVVEESRECHEAFVLKNEREAPERG